MASEEEISDLAMEYCGKLFFYSPEDISGFFINLDIAEIIEYETNPYIRLGYEIEAVNSRAEYKLDLTYCDDFEIEEKYKEKAKAAEAEGYIRFADSLRSVANSLHEFGVMNQRMYKDKIIKQ